MEKFFAALRNMFQVPDLRRRIGFTLGLLAIYRLGAHVTAPGINKDQLARVWGDVGNTLLGVLDLFSGGNFQTISVFALGVTPYITASIILQLMTTVFSQLKKLQEEGEAGRQKINQYTRYLTVVLAGFQTSIVARWLQANGVGEPGWGFLLTTMITLTTGTIFVMWLGEQITERGIGNGISLLIFAGIVIGLPNGLVQVTTRLRSGVTLEVIGVLALCVALVLLIAFIVFVEQARRKVPISYAKRHVGRQLVGGQQTVMPLKINMAGVIPVIFASSMLAFPQTILQFIQYDPANPESWRSRVHLFFQSFHGGDPYYELFFLSLIVIFTFFYITIIFNVEEVADNLRKHGGFIPGIRPGRNTAEFLNTILTRLTTVGAIYLALVALVPQIMLSGFNVGRLPFVGGRMEEFFTSTPGLGWVPSGMGYKFYFGGTSLLILVGVAMDTVAQIEAQLVMRNYEGFLGSGGRLRGRRT
ncbi:MAG: preprotein translocase subunit SecY [Pyrinomonadaceae bacterium]|nr:preprotein translocase subunit SecY [Pyrinomonadaceae bacterium]MDQ1590666.1 preprotein translocase subunit SecY [Pyrinomonadaceae bacterium]MDX6269012.1 preprotein translocase subunit SecY [Acidobacteriota bacterium]